MRVGNPDSLNKIVEEVADLIGWHELQMYLGVSRQTIWNWKTHFRTPSASVILRCIEIKKKIESEKNKDEIRKDENGLEKNKNEDVMRQVQVDQVFCKEFE